MLNVMERGYIWIIVIEILYLSSIFPATSRGDRLSCVQMLLIFLQPVTPKCVDYTTKCHCKHHHNASEQQQCTERKPQAQHHFLDKQLLLLKDIDTVIVHTRGEGTNETVRKWLLHFNLQNKWIHRHCFTGHAEEANLWISSFKYVKFSISSILLNSQQLQESVQTIPSSQLMLESDSPYLSLTPSNIQ